LLSAPTLAQLGANRLVNLWRGCFRLVLAAGGIFQTLRLAAYNAAIQSWGCSWNITAC
jgi:hypothetical protein